MHLLASLPESFNVLVTALEANPDVLKLEVVTERLLHEERKEKSETLAAAVRRPRQCLSDRKEASSITTVVN